MHHLYFEVNYAGTGVSAGRRARWHPSVLPATSPTPPRTLRPTPAAAAAAPPQAGWLDVMFDTFMARFKEEAKPRADAKSTLRALPSTEFLAYLLLACGCVAAWAVVAVQAFGPAGSLPSPAVAAALAALAGFGPVVVATAMSSKSQGGTPLFGKRVLDSVFQLSVGTLFCSVPVAWACYLALTPAAAGSA